MKEKDLFKKLNLQLFADDGAEGGEGGTETPPTEPKPNGTDKEPQDNDDKKYSDKDLDKIISAKFAKWQKQQEKAVKEAERLANMNAQEKAEHERDELQKELNELKKKDAIAEMSKIARKMLSDEQITVGDNVLSILVSDNAEDTKKAINDFSKAFKEAVEDEVKKRLKGEPPKRGSSGGAAPMTKEQIMAIADPELRQKKMLENRHLFNF